MAGCDVFAPLEGSHVKVTDRHTSVDDAFALKDPADGWKVHFGAG